MSEFKILKELLNCLSEINFDSFEVGPGDDCALVSLNPGSLQTSTHSFLVSSDTLVDRVHFSRDWSTPADIAWKILAVNESDIAAMGGIPLGFTLSLGCTTELAESGFLHALYEGFGEYLRSRKLKLYGGDLVKSDQLFISVCVFGRPSGNDNSKLLLRSGARAGDLLWVSGGIGFAGYGLKILRDGLNCGDPSLRKKALLKHRRPDPQTLLGRYLAESGLGTAAIDVSDGLFQDAEHIGNSSNSSIVIFPELLPVPNSSFFNYQGSPESFDTAWAEYAMMGDDYELLFTTRPDFKSISLPNGCPEVFLIGQVIERQSSTIFVTGSLVTGEEKEVFSSQLLAGCDVERILPKDQKLIPLTVYLADNGFNCDSIGYNHF
ncbi:MAG TPA: thiamine-phosphate kinase [Oligoflexia bacterium]|nr:thiamine-phosphate kinase [Oligoflexia bacterium]HMP48853.1 thiamine-phosphate kinase [Oligoflexia bacterium]